MGLLRQRSKPGRRGARAQLNVSELEVNNTGVVVTTGCTVDLFTESFMYRRTHLPKQLMAYPEFPFGETEGSFVTHGEMLKYLNEYANAYKLMRYIQVIKKPTCFQLWYKIK